MHYIPPENKKKAALDATNIESGGLEQTTNQVIYSIPILRDSKEKSQV